MPAPEGHAVSKAESPSTPPNPPIANPATDKPPPPPQFFMECISGPDMGKRFKVVESEVTVGKGADCNLLSDDADVAGEHAVFKIADGKLNFKPAKGKVFVDGQTSLGGTIGPGQQVRLGRSVWQMSGAQAGTPAASGAVGGGENFFQSISGHITRAAGMEQVKGFSFQKMFADVFKRRTDREIESHFIVGTSTTTPPLNEIDIAWPRPWAFAQILFLNVLVYIGFYFAVKQWPGHQLLYPGLVITGAFAVPFSMLLLFFELNVLKNISLFQVLKWFALGGVGSLFIALLGFGAFPFLSDWLGPSAAGPIEETAKGVILLIIIWMTGQRYRYTLNGMLFGACVGCGFQVFESAGYALRAGIQAENINTALESITLRGALSFAGMHTLWTACVGAGIWKVMGDRKFQLSMLGDVRFVRLYLAAIAMHMTWNSTWINTNLNLKIYLPQLVVGLVGWTVVMAILQDGLNQVRKEQQKYGSGVEQPRPGEPVAGQPAPAATT